MTWVVIAVFVLLWVPDLPGLLRRRQWPELVTFTVLWAAGLTMALFIHYGVQVDHMTQWLRSIFEPIGQRFITLPPES